MNIAIYTDNNRYNISKEDLEIFYKNISNNVIEIKYDNKIYLTDGYTLYLKDDFNMMIAGKLFPFPEHLSLKNKKSFTNKNIDDIVSQIEDLFLRPKISNYIFK